MAEEDTSSTPTEGSSLPELYSPSKKIDPANAMKTKVKSSHPTTAEMVTEAIVQLSERNGTSLPAIKKFIANTWQLDIEKQGIFIRRYLKSAVANGSLIQTKGRGASGSFKMPLIGPKATKKAAEQQGPAKKPVASKKTESTKNDAAAPTKKQASSKKVVERASSTVVKKTAPKKSAATVTEPKSPSKTKKVAKSPTSKPKAPRPKKVTATKSAKVVSPKKVTAAKK